jgi:hypothetical protein
MAEKGEDKKELKPQDKSQPQEAGEVQPDLTGMPRELRQIFEMSLHSVSGKMPSPIYSKLNESHIDRIIENAENDEKRQYSDHQLGRVFKLIGAVLGLAVFIFLIVFLSSNNSTLLTEIIKLAVAFGGGVGAGYGLKSFRKK